IHTPPPLGRSDRGVPAPPLPEGLHHVLRQLRRGAGAPRASRRAHMPILTLKQQPSAPLEAEALSPDVTAPLGLEAIKALPVHLGKRQHRVDDFFAVEGSA